MKSVLRWLALGLAVVGTLGCDDLFTEEQNDDVKFVNKSSYTVTVFPQANSDWAGFKLAPGEVHKLNSPSDVFFTYEPIYRVTIGDNENNRVLFINLKDGTEDASPNK